MGGGLGGGLGEGVVVGVLGGVAVGGAVGGWLPTVVEVRVLHTARYRWWPYARSSAQEV